MWSFLYRSLLMRRGTGLLRLFETYIGSSRCHKDGSIRLELGALVLVIVFWVVMGTVRGCHPDHPDLYEEYYRSMEEDEGEIQEDEEEWDDDEPQSEDPDEEGGGDTEETTWGHGEMCRT